MKRNRQKSWRDFQTHVLRRKLGFASSQSLCNNVLLVAFSVKNGNLATIVQSKVGFITVRRLCTYIVSPIAISPIVMLIQCTFYLVIFACKSFREA